MSLSVTGQVEAVSNARKGNGHSACLPYVASCVSRWYRAPAAVSPLPSSTRGCPTGRLRSGPS